MRVALLCALLAFVTCFVYLSALSNPFVNYDDPDYVTENAHVQQGLTSSTVEWAFGATTAGNWHPVTWLSHALDCDPYGLDPWGHHLTSIVIHCLNAVLILLLLRVATRKLAPSLVVAALFALHPLNVESVAWVAERKTVLSGFSSCWRSEPTGTTLANQLGFAIWQRSHSSPSR